MWHKTALECVDAETENGGRMYWKDVQCKNCNYKGSAAFYKNILITDHLCPICECKTLHLKDL